MVYRIERVRAKAHDRRSFRCGDRDLDEYLARSARQDMARLVSTCYVAVEQGSDAIAGYYTISQGSAALTDLPDDLRHGLPKYPLVPGTLIGRLAVSKCRQRRGLGEALLFDALRRAWTVAEEVGAAIVLVRPKDNSAATFYRKYGFEPTRTSMMYLPVGTIRALLEVANPPPRPD